MKSMAMLLIFLCAATVTFFDSIVRSGLFGLTSIFFMILMSPFFMPLKTSSILSAVIPGSNMSSSAS